MSNGQRQLEKNDVAADVRHRYGGIDGTDSVGLMGRILWD